MNPRLVVCFICGREFGSLSIAIHTPKCLEKWKVENNKLPKSQRRPEPKTPQLQEDPSLGTTTNSLTNLQRQNEAAYAAAKDATLSTCENCQRRFLPPQLIRHQTACRPGVTTFKRTISTKVLRRHLKIIVKKPPEHIPEPLEKNMEIQSTFKRTIIKVTAPPKSPGPLRTTTAMKAATSGLPKSGKGNQPIVNNVTSSSVVDATKSFSRPPTRVCFICGREFGTTSIAIHEPQCLEKWRVQNAKLPVRERRNEPQKPASGIMTGGGAVRLTDDQLNQMAYETFKSNLAQCDRCSRRFLPDRLVVHLRSCKG